MRWRAIATAAVLAAGCTTSGPGNSLVNPPPADLAVVQVAPLSPALSLAGTEQALEQGASGKAFNFASLRELWVRVTVPAVPTPPAAAMIDLTFKNPLGEVMYESTRGFSSDPSMKQMPMPGMSAPLTVYQAKRVPGGFALDTGLPLSGTNFTRYPTTGVGDWTVLVTGDGLGKGLTTTMTVSFTR